MSYAVAKLVPMQFPPLRPFDYELRVGELTPMRVLWDFMRYSRPYSFFAGASECLAVVLPCLRLAAVFVENRGVAAALQPTLLDARIPTAARWAVKLALAGSVTVSSFAVFGRLAASRPEATGGVNGPWGITSFTAGAPAPDGKAATPWRRLIVDPEILALRLDDDSLVRCRRTPVATDASLLAFQCRDGRKGELRATAVGSALRVEGTFDGATVAAAACRLDESDYPLMKGGLRIIGDRDQRSWIFSCRASIATNCSMRFARVSGFLGVWMRKSTE